MAEGDRKIRVAHQHCAGCMADEVYRPDGEALEHGRYLEVELVRAFLYALDGEVCLAAFRRVQQAYVVPCAELPVRPRVQHGHDLRQRNVVHLCHAQGIIVRVQGAVAAGRQDDLGREVFNNEVGGSRSPVRHHNKGAEILMQEPDVAGDHHDARNGRQVENAACVAGLALVDLERKSGKAYVLVQGSCRRQIVHRRRHDADIRIQHLLCFRLK